MQHYLTHYRRDDNYDASSESEIDRDMAREIREESVRIQKELELERKANRIRDTTPKSRETTPKSRETTPKSRDMALKSRDSTNSSGKPPKSRERTPTSREATPNESDRNFSTSSSRYATGTNTCTPTNDPSMSQISTPSLTSTKSVSLSCNNCM